MTIRRFPEDFVVRERLDDAIGNGLSPVRTDKATFAVFHIVKMSVTTPQACAALARELGIRAADIQFAGMKDRHACTSQIVTARIATAARAAMIPAQVSLQNMTADLTGWFARHVKAEDIAFNAFEIVVRNLTTKDCDTMDRHASLACVKSATESHEPSLLMPNYFGDQRFGYQRADTLAARHVIQCDYLAALKLIIATPHRKDSGIARETNRLCAAHWGNWAELLQALPRSPARKVIEVLASRSDANAARDAFAALPYIEQQMCIESFQSHLWNATVAEIVASFASKTWIAAAATGDHRFVESAAIPASMIDAQLPMPCAELDTSPVPPIGGAALSTLCSNLQHAPESSRDSHTLQRTQPEDTTSKKPLSSTWFCTHLDSVMKRENLCLAQLQVPGLRRPSFDNFSRTLFVHARNFSISPRERDDADSTKSRYKRTLRFTLPRGSYATVLLRMLGQ